MDREKAVSRGKRIGASICTVVAAVPALGALYIGSIFKLADGGDGFTVFVIVSVIAPVVIAFLLGRVIGGWVARGVVFVSERAEFSSSRPGSSDSGA